MVGLFPRFNDGESRLVSGLAAAEARRLAQLLRKVLRTIEELDEDSAAGVAGDGQRGEGDDRATDHSRALAVRKAGLWPRLAAGSSMTHERAASTIAVTGWLRAIGCIQPGIVSTAT